MNSDINQTSNLIGWRLSDEELDDMSARARAAMDYHRSVYEPVSSSYTPSGPEIIEKCECFQCPLCNGEGEIDGVRYDHKDVAGTVVAYGIGQGLGLAEDWVKFGPQDILDLIEEVRSLRSRLP